jgi:GT2 family glycosyltransferase
LSKKVAVVILNWNGKSFLEQFLPSVTQYSENARIIVIDNFSTDDSINFLTQNYPSIEIVKLEQNYGFAGGYNKGLKQIESNYYVLLNSDVEVTPNWLTPMLSILENNFEIAACQPKIKDYNKKTHYEYAGAAGGFIDKYGYPFCRGRVFDSIEKDNGQYDDEIEIFWATGACLFIRAELYHKEGGLDEFFFAHMEEIDLCWRLKNSGYKIMFSPNATVYHVGGGTLNKTNPKKTFLNFRNNLLMLHKNLPKNQRFSKIVTRLFLDGIAGLKFILSGKPSHTIAIFKSHLSFYKAIPQNRLKRSNNEVKILTGMLNQGIIMKYFLKKCKTYDEIVK